MYLILYFPVDHGVALTNRSLYKIVGAYNVTEALITFYEMMDSDSNAMTVDLFKTLVRHVSLHDGIELYNTISTIGHITAIYENLHEINMEDN